MFYVCSEFCQGQSTVDSSIIIHCCWNFSEQLTIFSYNVLHYVRLVHLSLQTFNEHHLRRSLKTLITYVQNDTEMNDDENFCEQVSRTTMHQLT